MIAEHESYFEKCDDLEAKRHGLALIKLIRNILQDCRSCPHRLHIEEAEPGLTLYQTMQKRLFQVALAETPDIRSCAYKLGLTHSYLKRLAAQYNVYGTQPDITARKPPRRQES